MDYRNVYQRDKGKGYLAVEILAIIGYVGWFFLSCFLIIAATKGSAAIPMLVMIPVYFLSIYIGRQILRAVLAWRDMCAVEAEGKS